MELDETKAPAIPPSGSEPLRSHRANGDPPICIHHMYNTRRSKAFFVHGRDIWIVEETILRIMLRLIRTKIRQFESDRFYGF